MLMGPRAPPPRDLRKNIIELRRENSELWFSSDDLDRIERLSGEESERRHGVIEGSSEVGYGSTGLFAQREQEREQEQQQQQHGRKKYLKLGRQASPVLPFLGFGVLSRADSIADVSTNHHGHRNEGEKRVQMQQMGSHRHVSGFDFGFDKSPFPRSVGQDVKQESTIPKNGQGDDGYGGEEESDDPRASMIVEKELSAYAYGSSLFSPLHSAQGDERKGEDARKSGMSLTSPSGEENATGTSVWEQGEKHWHQHQQSGSNDACFSTPNQSIRDAPRPPQVLWTGNEGREESDGTHSGNSKEGNATPRSLYDEGGFLRNSPLRGRVARLGQVGIY